MNRVESVLNQGEINQKSKAMPMALACHGLNTEAKKASETKTISTPS